MHLVNNHNPLLHIREPVRGYRSCHSNKIIAARTGRVNPPPPKLTGEDCLPHAVLGDVTMHPAVLRVRGLEDEPADPVASLKLRPSLLQLLCGEEGLDVGDLDVGVVQVEGGGVHLQGREVRRWGAAHIRLRCVKHASSLIQLALATYIAFLHLTLY